MPTQPMEKQPQVITSEDKKLQILNHAAGGDQFGCYTLKGAVRNISPEAEVGVKMEVDYFDADGVKIDSVIDTFVIPFPGGSRGFHIIYPGNRHDDIRSYTVSVSKIGS